MAAPPRYAFIALDPDLSGTSKRDLFISLVRDLVTYIRNYSLLKKGEYMYVKLTFFKNLEVSLEVRSFSFPYDFDYSRRSLVM